MEKPTDKNPAGFGRVVETYPYPEGQHRVLIESDTWSFEGMLPSAFAGQLAAGEVIRVSLRAASKDEEALLVKESAAA